MFDLSEEQAGQVQAIFEKAEEARKALEVTQTQAIRELLDETQAQKFDEMMSRRGQGRGERGDGGEKSQRDF